MHIHTHRAAFYLEVFATYSLGILIGCLFLSIRYGTVLSLSNIMVTQL